MADKKDERYLIVDVELRDKFNECRKQDGRTVKGFLNHLVDEWKKRNK